MTTIPSSTVPPTARLGIRDLATIGVFTAILFVLSIAIGTLTAIHPVVYLFDPALLALTGGVFFLLIAARVHKRGAVFLTAAIFGIGWAVLGGWVLAILMLIAGALGELLAVRGRYRSVALFACGWVLFALANFGGVFGVALFATDAYVASGERTGQDPTYVAAVVAAVTGWGSIAALVATVVCAVIGIVFARGVLRKHFATAG